MNWKYRLAQPVLRALDMLGAAFLALAERCAALSARADGLYKRVWDWTER